MYHRQISSGVWQCELWTNRDFEEHELVIAPVSSQAHESQLSFSDKCVLGLPRDGSRAPSELLALALDGNGQRGQMFARGPSGSLFWLVQRVPRPSQANISLDLIGWSHRVTLFLHYPKKPKHEEHWHSENLPLVPLMVNKKAIKAHTRLAVHQDLLESQDSENK